MTRSRLPHPSTQLTSFVGRERERAEVIDLLRSQGTRLLTLTGTGGVGKTRLALQAAAELAAGLDDAIWLVELAPLQDGALVAQSVAAAVGVRDEAGVSPLDAIAASIGERTALLVLDNCEHLIDACAQLAEQLLRACPALAVLATSREPLRIPGEVIYRVPSLDVPDSTRPPTLDDLARSAAATLFIERAAASTPGFQATNDNAAAIGQICTHLDGIPLAIELAAARVRLLPVEQIAARLDDRFRLLTGGARTALPRQQTLRALVDWSYDLLTDGERALFDRLSVFAGSFTLEAAETVCGGEAAMEEGAGALPIAADVLELLGQLVDKSLVVPAAAAGGEARFTLLETLRQYGLAHLTADGHDAPLRTRHRDWCLALATAAEPHLTGPEQERWLARLEAEHDNLRAALDWCRLLHERGVKGVESWLRLAGALWRFWYVRSYLTEGRRRLLEALAAGASAPPLLRAPALSGAGNLALRQGDFVEAARLHEEHLAAAQALEDTTMIASALNNLAAAKRHTGDFESAFALYEESLVHCRRLGDSWRISILLNNLGTLAYERAEYARARELYEESMLLKRQLGDTAGIVAGLDNLCGLDLTAADLPRAQARAEEMLALAGHLGDAGAAAMAAQRLGAVAQAQGRYDEAAARLQESLAAQRELGMQVGMAETLLLLAHGALEQGHTGRAAALLNECMAIRQAYGDPVAIADAQVALGVLAMLQQDTERATALLDEALTLYRQSDNERRSAGAVLWLAVLARRRGDLLRAAALAEESLALNLGAGDQRGVVAGLHEMAILLTHLGRGEQAARLLGGVEALRERLGLPLPPMQHNEHERAAGALREALGPARLTRLVAEGQALPPEELHARAMQSAEEPAPVRPARRSFPFGLTEREVEVLRLVAEGLTNAQVAERLVISPRTVNFYLTTIYGKLGVSNRGAAIRAALDQGIA